MGNLKKQYAFRGLDTRTNKLYRQEGTASDLRNVRLDSTRNLVKINDMDKKVIPRAADGATGDFLTELPYSAEIIDIMPYEDHFVLITKVRYGDVVTNKYVNKFYRWFRETNTVEFIPFQMEVAPNNNLIGQTIYKNGTEFDGGVTYMNIDDVLYFIGSKYPSHTVQDFTYNRFDEEFNRLPVLRYEGTHISKAGCPAGIEDTQTTDDGSLSASNDDYVRLLPFKIDDEGRFVYGNYSTHRGVNRSSAGTTRYIETSANTTDTLYDHIVQIELTSNVSLSGGSGVVTGVSFYDRGGVFYESAAIGQQIYGIHSAVDEFGFTTRATRERIFNYYRATITDIDYAAGTVTLGEFKKYNTNTTVWDDSTSFIHTYSDGIIGVVGKYLSNILVGLYGSDNFTFGYTLRAVRTYAYGGGSNLNLKYCTVKGLTGGDTYTLELNPIHILGDNLDSTVDVSTVKLPPPKARDLTPYVGSMVLVDEKSLYFSDFSVGGSLETFNPLDTFQFGSSEFGEVTGVFANETFLVGFRKQESYYITGNIFTANYRIQSYKSTRIGCSSPRSIIDFEGAGVFASERGIYSCMQGGQMREISDVLENLFTDDYLELGLDMTDVKAVIDFKREYAYFVIGGQYILAFNYYFKEWFLYDYIPCSGGFDLIDGVLYSSDGTNVYVEGSTSLEAGAYYRSNFETLGVPSFEKKFLQALMFCIDTTQSSTIGVKTYKDWNEDDAITDEEKTIDAAQVDVTQRFNPDRSKSVAIEIVSDSGNELNLNGYEYEYMDDVGMFKNDD